MRLTVRSLKRECIQSAIGTETATTVSNICNFVFIRTFVARFCFNANCFSFRLLVDQTCIGEELVSFYRILS